MTYEIITVENGDVLHRTTDREEAIRGLIGYVEQHRVSRPGIESEVALVEFGDDDRRQNGLVTYEQLAEEREAVF